MFPCDIVGDRAVLDYLLYLNNNPEEVSYWDILKRFQLFDN